MPQERGVLIKSAAGKLCAEVGHIDRDRTHPLFLDRGTNLGYELLVREACEPYRNWAGHARWNGFRRRRWRTSASLSRLPVHLSSDAIGRDR